MMTETIYDEAPWLFLHNCGDWNLTLTPLPQKFYKILLVQNCTSLIERALEQQLRPGFYPGFNNASQSETQRAWAPQALLLTSEI